MSKFQQIADAIEGLKSDAARLTARCDASGEIWYHGSGHDYNPSKKNPIYLTKHRDEAAAFAHGVHLGGGGSKPQVHKFRLKSGRVSNIDSDVQEAVSNGDLDETINHHQNKHAKDPKGARYLDFNHPSCTGKRDEFTARVALHPHEDLQHLGSKPAKLR